MSAQYDIAIVGAGMAGASLAAAIGTRASVVVLEAEDMPGRHATGRSAAFWEECYGGPAIVPLTRASGPFLRDGGFLTPRGSLYLAREADEPKIAKFHADFADTGATFARIEGAALARLVPGLRAPWDRAIWQRNCADIDVAALHAHFLASAKAAGAAIACRARLGAAHHDGARWHLSLSGGRDIVAGTLVNAAGAWADDVARAAGVAPIGIQPMRRTVAQLRIDPPAPADLPLCLDISGDFYFKPESGRLWLSPHDETPSAPCDAAPEELDVAIAIDRLEGVVDWRIEAVEKKWAGLRSFAPDRLPVFGFDAQQPGFFWCAGQGGFGIQTAPAAAALCASRLLGESAPLVAGIDPAPFDPARFD